MTTVKSIGRINGLNKSRVLQAQLAMPSFAQYALLTGTEIWIGQNENINDRFTLMLAYILTAPPMAP